MNVVKRIASGFKGFGVAIASVPRDVRRYMAMRRM